MSDSSHGTNQPAIVVPSVDFQESDVNGRRSSFGVLGDFCFGQCVSRKDKMKAFNREANMSKHTTRSSMERYWRFCVVIPVIRFAVFQPQSHAQRAMIAIETIAYAMAANSPGCNPCVWTSLSVNAARATKMNPAIAIAARRLAFWRCPAANSQTVSAQ